MMAAPEMSPTLDDALRALDGAGVNGVISAAQLAAVRGFLEQLDDVRECPAVVLEPSQAELMEGAYQAGVRCADESGHVLVVSLPAFLAFQGHGVPSSRLSWRAKLEQLRARWFGPASRCSCGRYQHADLEQHEPQCVGYGLGQAALVFDNDELDQWKARALAAEKRIRDEQFARLFAAPYGEKQHG